MISKIRVLSDQTINKIAAGEVIENPASVVKELVENSLDAGANAICVEIKGGGRQLIRVTDDGCGMSADDALLCLERHATSKISALEDIHHLHTMGFRGEAIPSIASISKFMLLTCPQEENGQGTLVIVEGGHILKCSPAACSPGTTIEIKSLFFNVPVRKKFQKSPAHDTAEILKMLSLLALGHPSIKFQLISNQETVLNTPVLAGQTFKEQLEARIKTVLGPEFFNGIFSIQGSKGDIEIEGFIGQPAFTRHNRTGQYLFINKRGVFSPLISYAVREGYGPSMSSNRHPVFVLHFKIPGSLVDVNVHPQKREVRLRQEQILKDLILHAVENGLQQEGISTFYELPPLPDLPLEPALPPVLPRFNEPEPRAIFQEPVAKSQTFLPEPIKSEHVTLKVLAMLPGYFLIDPKPLQQFAADSLCLVDQRCAHSRIIYEKLEAPGKTALAIQTLLIPYTFETTPSEAALLREHLESLNLLGISIKEFGPHTFIVDAIPTIFGQANLSELLGDLQKSIQDSSGCSSVMLEQKRFLAQSASRAAVSKSRKLSLEEAQALADQLMQCHSPFFCPYGKSTIFQITLEELSKIQNRSH